MSWYQRELKLTEDEYKVAHYVLCRTIDGREFIFRGQIGIAKELDMTVGNLKTVVATCIEKKVLKTEGNQLKTLPRFNQFY